MVTALVLVRSFPLDGPPGAAVARRLAQQDADWTPLDRAEAARALRADAVYHASRGRVAFAVESAALAGLLEHPPRELRIRFSKGPGRRRLLQEACA